MRVLKTFSYIGPNRRFDETVVEQVVEFDASDLAAISSCHTDATSQLQTLLSNLGLQFDDADFPSSKSAMDPALRFIELYILTALMLQRDSGHVVAVSGCLPGNWEHCYRILFEHEECNVGKQAASLALAIMANVFPDVSWQEDVDREKDLDSQLAEFRAFARPLAMPADTLNIIAAAQRLAVPVLKLDREPYEGVKGDFRIRANSLLMLGHARYHRIIDGTFCVDKSTVASGLLRDRNQVYLRLKQLGYPVAAQDSQSRNCISFMRARRSAKHIGYPVVVKPQQRSRGRGISLDIDNEAVLQTAFCAAQQVSHQVIVERFISGDTFKAIISGHQVLAVVSEPGGAEFTGDLHESIPEMLSALSVSLDSGMLVVTFVCEDTTIPLAETGGAIVDIEVAPELDQLLPLDSPVHAQAAEHFVRWLFPPGKPSRIPIMAITGTNGKTTTSRMTGHIMQTAGYNTGIVCTDGIYINGEQTEKGDLAALAGHNRLFESRDVDMAVCESHQNGLIYHGLSFDWCNIAVCLNVTYDHIGKDFIDSVEEMAELKRSLLERARDAAVLNADDENCRAMVSHLSAEKICLTSMTLSIDELRHQFPTAASFCVLEPTGDGEHIVIHDDAGAHNLLMTTELPASFGGAARFNINNAMHAAVICHLHGIGLDHIRNSLRSFLMTHKNAPFRMNVYDGLPFKVMVDFAHNRDGIRKISEFFGNLDVAGRKIICYSAEGIRIDEDIRSLALAAAGYFDLYICKPYDLPDGYVKKYQREEHEMPEMMYQALLDHGIPEEQVHLIYSELEALEFVLDSAREGDFIVVMMGYKGLEYIHEYMQDYVANYGN